MNTLFILIALTFSNGQMYDDQVTGNVCTSLYVCNTQNKINNTNTISSL